MIAASLKPRAGLLAATVCLIAALFICAGGNAKAEEELAAEAPAFEELVAALPDASFDEKAALADTIAGTGHPRAGAVLKALAGGDLYAAGNGRVIIAEGRKGPYKDALTGEDMGDLEDRPSRIIVNNRLRGSLRDLVALINLSSPEKDRRAGAAAAAFSASGQGALRTVERALEHEEDEDIKAALEEARAAMLLRGADTEADEAALLDAVETLRGRGDPDAMSVLMGTELARTPAMQEAVDRAVAKIQTELKMWDAAQNVYYGLSLGSVLLLAAIGLAITFGVMGVINMAHGEMIMLGAYTTYMVQQFLASSAPDLMQYSLVFAVPAAFLVSGAAGVAIERSIIRFLYGRPLETLLATWGLSLILQQAIRTIFGPTNKQVTAPDWMSGSFELGLMSITYSRLWIILFSLAVFALLLAFIKYTQFGTQMRAVTQNRPMAASMGVRTNWVDALTFGLGSGVAGIAGVALAQIDNVSPNLGQSYIIDSFLVVVFGGVGNLWGTLVGAMTLGVANKFLEPYAGAVIGKIIVLIFIILFIQRRPRGLFALKGRSVEA